MDVKFYLGRALTKTKKLRGVASVVAVKHSRQLGSLSETELQNRADA